MKKTTLPAPREYIEDGYSLVAEDPEDMVCASPARCTDPDPTPAHVLEPLLTFP